MRRWLWIFALLIYAPPVFAKTVDVRIVPSSYYEKTGRSIAFGQRFFVVITNVSKQPIQLWKEWCSWGYDNLSLEIIDAEGNVSIVKKFPGAWSKNFPDSMVVPPADHMIYEVTFDGYDWSKVPLSTSHRGQELTMRAIYKSAGDVDAPLLEEQTHKVWTGTASSPKFTYMFYR